MKEMKISIIGGGAMGTALAKGLIDSGALKPGQITIANPHLDKLLPLNEEGVVITASNIEAARNSDVVVLAVKPWVVESVIRELENDASVELKNVAVIVAGISADCLLGMFAGKPQNLSIVMPNTAMKVRQSMTFIVPVVGTTETVASLFSHVGRIGIIEERQIEAATALASCGIAYAMRYVRASVEGGVEMGLKASEAQEMVIQTLKGAAALLEQPGAHPESEIDKVTTPGGITIKGLNTMEKYGFSSAVIEGLKASRK